MHKIACRNNFGVGLVNFDTILKCTGLNISSLFVSLLQRENVVNISWKYYIMLEMNMKSDFEAVSQRTVSHISALG